MIYTTDALVLEHLPSDLPAEYDTAGERATFLARASGYVESAVGPRYPIRTVDGARQKFNDADDTVQTPAIIQDVTAGVAAVYVMRAMRWAVNLGGPDPAEMWKEAKADLRDIREGMVQVLDSAGTDYARSDIASNVDDSEATFTLGRYDADGDQAGDEVGTLDDL